MSRSAELPVFRDRARVQSLCSGFHWSASEEPSMDQCQDCAWHVPIAGSYDYGVCSSPGSPADGRPAFEHDHCDAFERTPLDARTRTRRPGLLQETAARWRRALPIESTASAPCASCQLHARFEGVFVDEWGVCGNYDSEDRARATPVEHGCQAHVAGAAWTDADKDGWR